MPARRRAPLGCGPQARWLCCSLLARDSCANGNKPGSSHNPGILESVLNRRMNRRISNFEVPVPRRSYVCGSIFVIRPSAVCVQLPLPANRHSLFNPAPPEAMLTYNPVCSSLAPCQQAWGPAAKCEFISAPALSMRDVGTKTAGETGGVRLSATQPSPATSCPRLDCEGAAFHICPYDDGSQAFLWLTGAEPMKVSVRS